MPIVEDRLSVDSYTNGFSGPGVNVWREPRVGKIWIATCSPDQSLGDAKRFVGVELARLELEQANTQDTDDAAQKPIGFGGRLSVNISTALLRDAGMDRCLYLSGMTLTDPIAFELVIGIVEACSFRKTNAYTKSCMVKMLCAQIVESASTYLGLSRCRGAGLADWQRVTLEMALSEVGECEISLESFATRCGLSVCQFARLFKITYGIPFHQHIVERKIFRACELLSGTQDSISQIALACGFSDQSSFTRRFSAQIGNSPASWRKVRFLPGASHSLVAESLVTQ